MMKLLTIFVQPISMKRRHFIYFILAGFVGLLMLFTLSDYISLIPYVFTLVNTNYRRRPECTCMRPELPALTSILSLEQNDSRSSLCSLYATQRGAHQRIISISLFGPKENNLFLLNRSLLFLDALIEDLNIIYSDGFILRVYHDGTINTTDIVCPIECKNPNVDFCDVSHKSYMPPKIWRFIPAGDPLVDVSKLKIFIFVYFNYLPMINKTEIYSL